MPKDMMKKLAIAAGAGGIGFVLLNSPIGFLVGAAVGFALPTIMESMKAAQYVKQFAKQLPDAISLLSSCLKAGLSLNQAFEVLVAETTGAIHEEFMKVTKELRIGMTLDDAFFEMSKRVPLEELKLVFTAVLVARETGGELPKVLGKLVDTLRDRRRLEENIATYTIQGQIQAVIMGLIPVGFIVMVLQQDPHHFDIMTNSETGRLLLWIAGALQIVAVVVVYKVSKIKI